MVRLAPQLIIAALLLAVVPVAADHVASSEIRWACGFGGSGQTGHPANCGINPVGGGADVGEAGPPVWGDAWTDRDEPVLALRVGADARAIPVVMLDSHEIANIVIGGQNVAVTYCPLCGSGVAFLRDIALDGETITLDLAASGFLYQSDLVMWDPQTGTLWNQISGTPIGTLETETVTPAHHGVRLDTLPMLVTAWGEWVDAYPDAVMLQKVRGSYGYPYGGYETDERRCGLGDCRGVDDRLHPKELVIGLATPGPAAFPIFGLRAAGGVLVTDVDDKTVVVTTSFGGQRVLDATGVGLDNATGVWLDAEGDTWDLAANLDSAGESLPELESLRLFWFAWAEHYPDTALWQPPAGPTSSDDPGSQPLQRDNGKLPGFAIPVVAGFLLLGALLFRFGRRA